MPTFTFVATDQQGKPTSGSRPAASRQELIARLRAENMVVTSVAEEAGPGNSSAPSPWSQWREDFVRGGIQQSDLMVFTRQLAAMLKAGVAITDALHTIGHGIGNDRLREILLQVRSDVQRGRSLTEAMRRHPQAFDSLFLSIINAGESSGSLVQNVQRLSEYLDRREKFRRKLQSATAYPKFVIGFFTVLTSGIFLFIIPRFKEIFDDFGAKLPPLTQVCMGISLFLRNYFFLILPLAVGLVVAVVFLRRTRRGSEIYERTILQIPFFGKLLREAAVARMAMTLGMLLSNGIPLTDALNTATGTLGNSLLEERLRNVRRDVMTGLGLAESLARVEELPRLLPRMVRVGEESGTLSGMLTDVASYYDQEVDHALGKVTSLVEPVLICGMGIVVLFTVLAIYLPIFKLGSAMHG